MQRIERLSAHLCSASGSSQIKKDFESEGVQVVGDVTAKATERTLEIWHKAVGVGMAGKDQEMMSLMDEILDDNILFLAPTYHKERRDPMFVKYALVGVTNAFKNFKYTRAFFGNEGFALEFECNIGEENGPFMRGIDLVTVNEQGKIVKFEVMARPPKAVLKLLDFQTSFLQAAGIIKPKQ